MKNKINDIFQKNRIPFEMLGDNFAIICPFKPDMDGNSNYLATFQVNSETGRGSCAYCGESADFDEILRLLNIGEGTSPSGEKKRTFEQISPRVADPSPKETAMMRKSGDIALHPLSMGDILTHDFGTDEWVVESLIPRSGMMILSGSPGDFKTWVTIHIAVCVSRGEQVFGRFKTVRGNVLVIDEEDNLRDLQKRLKLLGAKDTDSIHYLSQSSIKVDDEPTRNAILKIVKEKDIKLIIIDSLVRVHHQDENDARGMAKVFGGLQEILKADAAILFTHHHRKQMGFGPNNPGQSMRGSSDILAAVDCHVTIEKKKDEKDRLVLRQTKLRQAEALPPFEVNILKSESGPAGFEYAGGHDEKKKKAEEVSEAVITVLAEGTKSRMELQEALGNDFGKTAIDNGIRMAEEAGQIERVPAQDLPAEDRRKACYRLPPPRSTNTDELPASQPHIGVGNQDDDNLQA